MTLFTFTTNSGIPTDYAAQLLADRWPSSTMVSHAAYITGDVLPGKGGRLHYLATEWGAYAVDNSFIAAGTLVKPIVRQGNTWLVAALDQTPPQQVA